MLIKPNGEGLSAVFDHQGRVLSTLDYWTSDHNVMLANVPTEAVTTFCLRIGDAFVWICMSVFVASLQWSSCGAKSMKPIFGD